MNHNELMRNKRLPRTSLRRNGGRRFRLLCGRLGSSICGFNLRPSNCLSFHPEKLRSRPETKNSDGILAGCFLGRGNGPNYSRTPVVSRNLRSQKADR